MLRITKTIKALLISKKKIFSKKLLIYFFLAQLMFASGILVNRAVYYKNKFFPNTYIAGFNVSSLTKNEAVDLLKKNIITPINFEVNAKEKVFDLSLQGVEFSYDYDKSVESAFSNNRNPYFPNFLRYYFTKIVSNSELKVNYNKNKLDEYLQIIASQVASEPVLPSVSIKTGQIIIEKGSPGEYVDYDNFNEQFVNKTTSNISVPLVVNFITDDTVLTIDEEGSLQKRAENLIGRKLVLKNEFDVFNINEAIIFLFLDGKGIYYINSIEKYVSEEIEPKVNREPQNAVFKFENNKVLEFTPAKNGLIVDRKTLVKEIINNLSLLESSENKSLDLTIPVEVETPQITTDKVNDLGIKELIGRGSSTFRGSIPGRVYNIGLASSKFNGVLIAPDDTVSFNNIVGDISRLTGYKSAYIIKDGKTVLGDGGGVCQVSTTLFRAALNAGLPIIERSAHSYRVGYYEQDSGPGLDATIFSPTTDLKFKNDTPGHILIQTIYNSKNSSLVFELYGTDDGRIATISKPIVTSSSAPPEDLYVDDPNLPAGTVKQIDYKAWGAKVNFNYKVEKNSEVLIDKTFYSNYRPWQSVFLRGTGPAI